ncbi:response regulator [Desertivirga arenae]|uniref:response regulator n=1 Tax=Desertivirga arenae TaxID=2810309 RepID=UPI001A979287|nr:response regulator [Pedobacter sp. SYSU D00823]
MKKILLIEDDSNLRENIAEILSLSYYSVVLATDGKEGVEKALREKPDLILCDVAMPGLDGFGVLHVISRHPDTSTIPFIFMTGRRELGDLRKGMNMGADDFLIKPVGEDDLLNAIEIRLKKTERLKRNIAPDKAGLSEFMHEVNQSELFNLSSTTHDIHHYKKKHLLYSEGEKPVYVYFVIRGKLKGFLINEDAKEFITNMYTKGDFFGYTAVIEDINYMESVQVLEEAELMLIPKSDFLQLLNNDRQVAAKFIAMLAHNIREKEEKLLNLAYNSLRKKVAKGIITVIDKFKDEKHGKPVVEISREDLANIVGAAQESLIRTLKEFKTENLIEIVDGTIYVVNENKLRHLLY